MNGAIEKSLSDKGVLTLQLNRPEVLNAMNADLILGLLEHMNDACLLYTSPSPRDRSLSRMPSSA